MYDDEFIGLAGIKSQDFMTLWLTRYLKRGIMPVDWVGKAKLALPNLTGSRRCQDLLTKLLTPFFLGIGV